MAKTRSKKANNKNKDVVYGKIFNKQTVDSLLRHSRPLLKEIDWNHRGMPKEIYKGLSNAEIEKIIKITLSRLPVHLRKAKRPIPTKSQNEELRGIIREYLKTEFSTPTFNAALIKQNTEFAGLKFQVFDDNFIVSHNGETDLIIYNITNDPDHEKSTLQKLVFAIDLTIEVFGFILGIIGIAAPRLEPSLLKETMEPLMDQPWFKRALAKLIDGLRQKEPGAVLEFLEALEGAGNLGELLGHFIAGLSYLDWLITIAKIIAWIVAAVASGGAALAAKIITLGLDMVGIYLKIEEAGHFT